MAPTPSSQDRKDLGRGLVLFPLGTAPRVKRRRLLFTGCYLLVIAAIVWPVYPLFAGTFPLIFGLPLSLAWIVGALAVGFAALLTLYFTEEAP